jgi:hypothetical protein
MMIETPSTCLADLLIVTAIEKVQSVSNLARKIFHDNTFLGLKLLLRQKIWFPDCVDDGMNMDVRQIAKRLNFYYGVYNSPNSSNPNMYK